MPRTKLPEVTDAAKAVSHPLRFALFEAILQATTADPDLLVAAHDAGTHGSRRPGCPKCFGRTDSLSPNELATLLGERLTNTSYHVRQLVDLGVIRQVAAEARRGALEHYYAATCDIVIGVEPVHHNGREA